MNKLLPHQMQILSVLTNRTVYSALNFAYLYHHGFIIFFILDNKHTY